MKQDQPRRSISIAASCAVAATLLVAVPGIGGSSAVADSTVAVQVGGRGGVPTDATAAVVNITATNAAAPGWAVAWPCNTTRPEASTVNFQPGQTTANSSIVKLDDNGQACIYTSATTDVIVDVSGAFNPGTDFNPLTPTRLLDTRPTPPPPPPTTAPPTTNPPGTQFVATFDNNTGLDAFRTGIFHRDNTLVTQTSWPADHDTNCGPPNTQRTITRGSDGWNYLCRNHLMTAIGDTSGYSIGWFAPKQTFNHITEVCWEVNLTNLGSRQWWKVAVLSTNAPDIMTEVGASGLTGIEGPDRAIASWGGVGGWKGKLRIGEQRMDWYGFDAGNDKMTRYPACFRDNGNGTLSFEMTGPKDGGTITTETFTTNGSFPTGPLKVVFQDHNYTPTKDDNGVGTPIGFTWHWDNLTIR